MHSSDKIIKIGTRGSKLALWQAKFTQKELAAIGVESELHIIKTKGDTIQHLSFDKIEGKGFFTKEIEETLLRGEVHMAVHSMKDLPTNSPEGLVITAVSHRADPADWLVVRKSVWAATETLGLAQQAIVGTSSARRKSQLKNIRPDLQLQDIRGNVPTRLRKLSEGQFDGIVLAAAGLTRLEMDLSDFEVIKFSPKEFVPAPAQGVLAFQACTADKATRRILQHLHQKKTAACTNIERKILNLLDGGCQLPLGAYCEQDLQGNYHVWATMAEQWDAPLRSIRRSSSTHFQLAEQVVAALKEKQH